ncbi:reticulon-3 isoform X3 [Syngnathoides biaculeatus]|uniref:reticulon-3 isoform X3 n=1 Tax=Syngnathoides biaculeatus TaxID=300417 RepID=UPI002ADDC4E2|nr:reticulon-3 isoform X3 [Syngnathoides biaculeatus]
MDPMTQSAQISSSQGLADGQNSASKEPRPSDSFLSSSPVSVIQSSQDKKTVLGSSKPADEGVATALRFSSQPGSFSPDNYGGEAQPDSPVRMSPVSERIKALEALAAKKQTDFRGDSCANVKERHHDKSPRQCVEKNKSGFQRKTGSPGQDSPESPFEVLGEFRQMNEFEETEAWMKAHAPPVPDLQASGFVSFDSKPARETTPFAALTDVHNDAPKVKEPQKEASVEEADFDLDFLPTAYMWTQPENSGVRAPSQLDSEHAGLPHSLSGFESTSPLNDDALDAPDDGRTTWTGELETTEAKEVDSSGESEETVIEDSFTAVVPSPNSGLPPSGDIASSPATSTPDAERVTPPLRSGRKLMQVPTINVIETDEPNCSDEEFEMEFEEEEDEVVNEEPKTAETPPDESKEASKRRPVETEFMEGYSPPSSPVQSDDESAPQEPIFDPQPDAFPGKLAELNDSGLDLSLETNKDTNSPIKGDEWSDDSPQSMAGQDRADFTAPNDDKDVVVFSRNSILRGDTYEGQSFDFELRESPFSENAVTPKEAKDRFLLESAEVDSEPQDLLTNCNDGNASAGPHVPQNPSDISDAMASEKCSAPEPVDSFVEFMRECLKSRKGEEVDDSPSVLSDDACGPQSPQSVRMDPEREWLTISALEQLAGTREAEEETLPPPAGTVQNANAACIQQASFTPLTSAYSEDVDAVDMWVAEAYHLVEHVLTAMLTHVSVKDLLHWRDPKKSGLVFGVSMLLLLSLAAFSVISVVSYLLLALLCVTITFRIYKSVVQAVQKSSDGHPFKSLIEKDVSIPPETFRKHVDSGLTYINRALKHMSRLFLVEDLVDSLKLAVVMWLLTYVGAVFNGITILILADILLFAVPPIYEKNKTQIDQYVDLARTQINTTIAKLQEKLPGAVKRSKSE